jgi:uncharacterized protein YjcR
MWDSWEGKEIHKKFWTQYLKGKDHSEKLGIYVNMILDWILRKQGGKMWTGWIWLRKGTSGGIL